MLGACCAHARDAAPSNNAINSGARNTDLIANRIGAPALRTDPVISPSTGSEALRTPITKGDANQGRRCNTQDLSTKSIGVDLVACVLLRPSSATRLSAYSVVLALPSYRREGLHWPF